MEDSLENYIQLTRSTEKDPNADAKKEIRQKELITLQRKKEYDARALKMVEFLIEGKLRSEVFLRCLKHINQSHYQDVVEERAISNLCGYPLCGKQISEFPKQQYFINTRSNKVYDVTQRKNYCRNFCYEASLYLKHQIDESPLWLRKPNDEPKIQLLNSTDRCIPGEEINLGIAVPSSSTKFTSVTSFAEISLDEIAETGVKNTSKKKNNSFEKAQSLHTIKEVSEISKEQHDNNLSNAVKTKMDDVTGPSENKINNEIIQSPSSNDANKKQLVNENQISVKKKTKPKKQSGSSKSETESKHSRDMLEDIKKYVLEWLTLETYIFLYGETHLRDLLNEKQLEEYVKKLKSTEITVSQKKRYLEICQKLRLSQVADDIFDRTVIGNKLKPVPEYKTLKEESKFMDLKVHSFYSGEAYNLENEYKKKNTININETAHQGENQISEEGAPAVLPLVDTNSKIALRQKIFLNSINKAILTLSKNVGIPSQVVLEQLKLLVKTFNLQPYSVVFKPPLWNVIAFILIKMLSMHDSNLKMQLETKRSESFIVLMLSIFPNGQSFICDLFQNIEDMNLFLERYFYENN